MRGCTGRSGGMSRRRESDTLNVWIVMPGSIFTRIAYTPYGAILPQCGATLQNVTEDIKLLSQLTPRIRLYASDWYITPLFS